jgi:DNA-binding IclR family transcriptional regulator
MSPESEIFMKIKEISTRTVRPRPSVDTTDLAQELGITKDKLMPHLNQLKQLRLLNFDDTQAASIKLTLLGTVVKR